MAKSENPVVTEAAAFARGRAEYTAGIPNMPPYTASRLANVWRHGYHFAATERTKGANIPLYSDLPSDIDDPALHIAALYARARVAKGHRGLSPTIPLPWTMETLIGSRWRNMYTGHMQSVVDVVGTFWQQVEPVWTLPAFHPVYSTFSDGIGTWFNGRYLVEHWIRVDLLPATIQLAWYGIAIAYARRSIAREQSAIGDVSAADACAAINRSMHRSSLDHAERSLHAVIAAAHAFADTHEIVVPATVLNAGLAANTTPTQLALF